MKKGIRAAAKGRVQARDAKGRFASGGGSASKKMNVASHTTPPGHTVYGNKASRSGIAKGITSGKKVEQRGGIWRAVLKNAAWGSGGKSGSKIQKEFAVKNPKRRRKNTGTSTGYPQPVRTGRPGNKRANPYTGNKR